MLPRPLSRLAQRSRGRSGLTRKQPADPSALTRCAPRLPSTPSYQTRVPHLHSPAWPPNSPPKLQSHSTTPFPQWLSLSQGQVQVLRPCTLIIHLQQHLQLPTHTKVSLSSCLCSDYSSAFVPNSPPQTPPSSQHLPTLKDSAHGPLLQEAFVGIPRLLLPWAPLTIPTSQSLRLAQ